MRRIVVALIVLSSGLTSAQTRISFDATEEGAGSILSSSVRLDDDRLATIAVVGADPSSARIANGGGALKLLGHDPVTRLTILERLTVWFREMGSVRWAYAAGGAYALLMVLFFVWPKGTPSDDSLMPASQQQSLAPGAEPLNVLEFDPVAKEPEVPASQQEF